MLFDIYIIIQILAIGAFILSWYSKNVITWTMSIILFSILMISGFNLEFLIFTINDNSILLQTVTYSSLIAYVNILFFALSLIMFFWDIFTERLN